MAYKLIIGATIDIAKLFASICLFAQIFGYTIFEFLTCWIFLL